MRRTNRNWRAELTDTTQGNAMTEIALAMAMGFFSIMVLTMMSMGIGVGTGARKAVAAVVLVPAATGGNHASSVPLKDDDILVIYDGQRFLGRDLTPVDPGRLDTSRRIILAIDPALPLSQAMQARQRIDTRRLVVTTLNADWRRALRERNHDR